MNRPMELSRSPFIRHAVIEGGILKVVGLAWNGSEVAGRIELLSDLPLAVAPSLRVERSSSRLSEAEFQLEIPVVSLKNLTRILLSRVLMEFSEAKKEIFYLFPKEIVNFIRDKQCVENIKIGIGITTWNRGGMLEDYIHSVQKNSLLNVEIFVSDDGSTDGTRDILSRIPDIKWMSAKNRGISWNKNRVLFYLHQVSQCDIVLMIEDDLLLKKRGWDIDWFLATVLYGHINYAPASLLSGDVQAKWDDPLCTGLLVGQCCGFTREALNFVGYLDPRFGHYGHEHVEHTLRLVRAGYGGLVVKHGTRDCLFYLMHGGLDLLDAPSSGSEEKIRKNQIVFDAIWNESIFRQAWRNDDEMRAFRREILSVVENSPALEG